MKRCFSKALILALIASIILTPVLAQASEIIGDSVETAVMRATDAGDTGLSVEGMANAPEQTPEEAAEESPEETGAPQYTITSAEDAPLAPDDDEAPSAVNSGEIEIEITSSGIVPPENVTAIRINHSSVKIGVNEQYNGLEAIAEPDGVAITGVTWRSSNTKYATVDAVTGVVTGVKKGTAIIYATTTDGLEASCKVKVRAKPKGISVEPTSTTISKGMSGTLKIKISGGASGRITYVSNKPDVVMVDENGAYAAIGVGSATITAKTYNGKKAKCKVKVLNEAAALTFPEETLSVALGESANLTPVAVDSDGNETVADVTYNIDPSSPDALCIALDANTGAISPLRMGRAVVVATTHNNIAASCNVVVANPPADVTLHPDSITIGVGETYALTAEPIPQSGETECATGLTWASSNKKIASVNAQGCVKGKKTGTCTIRVTTDNGKEATCKVKVVKAPSKVSISPAVGALRVGKTGKYKITLSPKGSGGSVTYASSNPDIATIDENGVVTAVAVGEVYIGVKTYNGKTAKAKLVISAALQESEQQPDSKKVKTVINLAKKQVGKPYVYGSGYADDENPRGFDCSGLVYWLFKHVGVTLLDSAYRQGYDTRYTRLSMSELAAGDVIFFNTNTSDSDLSDHSALYIGDGNFIHASSTANKVIVSNLSTPGSYYYRTFSWGHRVL